MLEIEHLDVHYGDLQVLWDISLEVDKAEIVALLGSNGAGKSSLLRTVTGLTKPTRGQIRYNGIPIHDLPPHKIVALGISMVPEGRHLFPKMTVLQNLEVGAVLKESRQEKNEILDSVFEMFPVLKPRSQQLAGSLSGGEQQMLAIGRALMAKNRFLLLDEMSLGLAPLLVKQIFDIVVRISSSGMGIFIVEQNVPMTLKIANRAYILESGQIKGQGDARSLLNDSHVREAYLGMG